MSRRFFTLFFVVSFFFNCCVCELSVEKKLNIYNGFLDYLKMIPGQQYVFHQATLGNVTNLNESSYSIEISFTEDTKFIHCSGIVYDKEDGAIEVANNYECQEDSEDSTLSDGLEETVTEWLVFESPYIHQPVKLDNEVQTEPVTSGEQFIAVPRDGQPCIGCASQVNPEAAGVPEMALLGVTQLDRLEPGIRHSLNKVLNVERQVQVVNGVRYVLTILIDYNNCSETVTEDCSVIKTCKISILDKPWAKLPDGSRYRIVVTNNCTEAWLFEDTGEESGNDRDKPHNFQIPTPDYSGITNTGSLNDIIQSVHNPEVQAQPEIEKALTDEEIKNIEEQIIPNSQFIQSTTENHQTMTNNVDDYRVHKITNIESHASTMPSNAVNDTYSPSQGLNRISEDKKKAIDDLLIFFDYAGFNQKENRFKETTRMKRSYEKELKMFNMAENFNKMRKSIDHAKYIYSLAQAMVDYLNDLDISVKNQILSSVVSAEEEVENSKHYFYIQARVIIPCNKVKCEGQDKLTKICNGVIDSSNERSPQVLNTFCFNEGKKSKIGKSNVVSSEDPVLTQLVNTALKTIELESLKDNALRVIKIYDANTQKVSGTLTKITILLGHTNCSKTVVFKKRNNCFIDEKLGTKLCDVEVLEKHWLKETKISYICTDRPIEKSFVNKNIDHHINDPDVAEILQEALQYLEIQSNKNSKQKLVDVKSVSTRLLSGLLIKIEFSVGYTTCTNDYVDNLNRCELLKNETLRKCEVQLWQRPWLEDGRQMNVTCDIVKDSNEREKDLQIRKKRDLQPLYGGRTDQDKNDSRYKALANAQQRHKRRVRGGLTEQDNNDRRYRVLAEESLVQYVQVSGALEPHTVTTVDKVTTQVVAGSLTRIDFTALKGNNEILKCHSEVWERPWLKKKDINVTCGIANAQQRHKRQVAGGLTEQDKNDRRYRVLAEESLVQYMQVSGALEPHTVTTVDKVTTQVVAGSMTRIDFTALKGNNEILKCHSEVLEQSWLKNKDIKVTCGIANAQQRHKRQVLGGLTEQDKNDRRYRVLAEESLEKYMQVSGALEPHTVTTVDKVTTQVVAGSLSRIDFTALKGNNEILKCHSEVLEQSWLKNKDIKVTCGIANAQQRHKRQVPGGLTEQDKNDRRYRVLAEESLVQYVQVSGALEPHTVTTVDKVTTQVVAGSMTRIDFTALKGNNEILKCHSEVWERPWLKKKDINVTCGIANAQQRHKRQVAGGLTEQDKNDRRYRVLAEESLVQYVQVSGALEPHTVTTVDKVTTQVVAGSMTRIDFTALKGNNEILKCHSEVWERPWLKKKDINVTCGIANAQQRHKRQVPGGLTEQDKNDRRYRVLAEESLVQYVQVSGALEPHTVTTVDKVTTQVVAGSMTRIDFTALKGNNEILKCHSEVWERPWLKKKDINVTCGIANAQQRHKRQVAGGLTEQDKNDRRYRVLAEESLVQYVQVSGALEPHTVTTVDKVTTQVVAGSMTRIDFTALKGNNEILKCHSEVWERPWLKKKDINVTCGIANAQQRHKRRVHGGLTEQDKNDRRYRVLAKAAGSKVQGKKRVGSSVEQDPNKDEYKILADESLRKHQKLQKSTIRYKVLEVKRVVTQVVSGIIYKIDYTAVPTACSENVLNTSLCDRTDEKVIVYCHADIWDRPWLRRKNIDVSCLDYNIDEDVNNDLDGTTRSKRSLISESDNKDIDDEYYKKLAEAAIEKYHKQSKLVYFHRLVKINEVSERIVQGFLTIMKFSISPTTCLLKSVTGNIKDCPFQKPKAMLTCFAEIFERPISDLTSKDIVVTCEGKNKHIKQGNHNKHDIGVREKRQTRTDENEIDDDAKYLYAYRAVKSLNQRSDTANLQKLITIHDVANSFQMDTSIVTMYIETAYTYCLKHNSDSDLSDCDELDGTNHRICFVKVFPSADDDLVILKVLAVCDDEPEFLPSTHLHIPDLLVISLVMLQRSPDVKYKLVHRGEPNVVPSLHSHIPVKITFIVASTNCSKEIDVNVDVNVRCFVDNTVPDKICQSFIYMIPVTKRIIHVTVNCTLPKLVRTRRTLTSDNTTESLQKMVQESLEKLEMSSLHRYKQRVIKINSYSTKLTTGRVTTIDFDVGYTNCLKYEWVDDVTTCEFIEHLPRRHCISEIWERLWLKNGRQIEVTCQDDETPLEAHVEFESADIATRLAQQALKHIEAKYPHPKKQQLVRIYSLEKQVVAGIHYRLKIEVGFTNCFALSLQKNCSIISDGIPNRFCRINVWLRPWTDHPPNFRVTCDYQAGATTEMYYHIQAEQLFFNFITTYKPEYVNDNSEMTKRFEIFKDNIKKIHELNTHEKGTGEYAVTRFADLTYEEFKTKYLGLNLSLRKSNEIPMRQAQIPKMNEMPDSFDWRQLGAVTDVKDQGSCGSCWAFSVTGNIEGQWKLKTGKLLSLSEQELVDCDKLDSGCNGGYMDNAYRAIEELGGLETEDEYPYEAEDDKCTYNKTLSKVQISGAVNISSNETEMAKWLVHNGPISIGINANAMQFYVGGVSHPWKMLCNPEKIDHGVLIVGYGIKDYPLFNKKLPYWIVKNSWGPSWGEQGYYRVFRGDGTCGVNTMASSAVV